jgi:hypothetical protein
MNGRDRVKNLPLGPDRGASVGSASPPGHSISDVSFARLRGAPDRRGAYLDAGKARSQQIIRTFSPGDRAPCTFRQTEPQLLGAHAPSQRTMFGYRTHFNSRHDAGFSVNTRRVLDVWHDAVGRVGNRIIADGSLYRKTCSGSSLCVFFLPPAGRGKARHYLLRVRCDPRARTYMANPGMSLTAWHSRIHAAQ